MNNTIIALSTKRSSLVSKKIEIQSYAERKVKTIDKEIAEIDKAIAVLNNAVKDLLCPVCGGCGTVRHTDAAGQMEDWDCEACNGTGIQITD